MNARVVYLLLLVFAVVLGRPAFAADVCGHYSAASNGMSFTAPDAQTAATDAAGYYCTANSKSGCTATLGTCTYGASCSATIYWMGAAQTNITASWVVDSCPMCPTAGSTTLIGVGSAPSPSGLTCYEGCEYQAPTITMVITAHGAAPDVYDTNVAATGHACGPTATPSGASPVASSVSVPPDCSKGSTVLACEVMEAGQDCGTFNGDEVCVTAVPDSSCVAYPSGADACRSDAAPKPTGPAPNDGTVGVAPTPDGTVSLGSVTVNYYGASTVAGSTAAPTSVSANNGGSPTGTGGNSTVSNPSSSSGGGSSGGTVSISGTVATSNSNAAADGDCSAATCAASAPSGLDVSGLTYDGVFQTFWTSVQSAPLVSSVSSVSSAWPAGSCDLGSVQLATLNNASIDYGTQFCSVWNADAAPALSVIALACYALVGILILMSA